MISVSIVGATGRMGTLTSELVAASEDLVLHSALNKEVIPENLGNRPVLLELFSLLADFLRKAVQEVERRAIRIQRGHR